MLLIMNFSEVVVCPALFYMYPLGGPLQITTIDEYCKHMDEFNRALSFEETLFHSIYISGATFNCPEAVVVMTRIAYIRHIRDYVQLKFDRLYNIDD